MNKQPIVSATRAWLTSFVIAHNICPFARQVYENDSVRFEVIDCTAMEESLTALIEECRHLDAEPKTETTLLIFAEAFSAFDDFLDLVAIAEQLLIEQGYDGIYQLAHFHPDYCFEGSTDEDPSNYTNRSPYPMLHIIREASLEQALRNYPNPENIPERNIALTRELGIDLLRKRLAACATNQGH